MILHFVPAIERVEGVVSLILLTKCDILLVSESFVCSELIWYCPFCYFG